MLWMMGGAASPREGMAPDFTNHLDLSPKAGSLWAAPVCETSQAWPATRLGPFIQL